VLNNVNSNQPFLAVHGFPIDRIPSNDGCVGLARPCCAVLAWARSWASMSTAIGERSARAERALPVPGIPPGQVAVDVLGAGVTLRFLGKRPKALGGVVSTRACAGSVRSATRHASSASTFLIACCDGIFVSI
jgi:hypothetical protein